MDVNMGNSVTALRKEELLALVWGMGHGPLCRANNLNRPGDSVGKISQNITKISQKYHTFGMQRMAVSLVIWGTIVCCHGPSSGQSTE